MVPAGRFRLDLLSRQLLIESPWLQWLVGPGSSKVISRHFSSSLRLGSSSDLLGRLSSSLRLGSSSDLLAPFLSQVFSSGLTRMPFSIQLIPYIPLEMADCFPRAELSRKHHFRSTPKVMTSFPVIPEVWSWTGRDDRKWYGTSCSNTRSDFVSLKKPTIHPQGSSDIYWAAAPTLYQNSDCVL